MLPTWSTVTSPLSATLTMNGSHARRVPGLNRALLPLRLTDAIESIPTSFAAQVADMATIAFCSVFDLVKRTRLRWRLERFPLASADFSCGCSDDLAAP